jgi:hypothetical protein
VPEHLGHVVYYFIARRNKGEVGGTTDAAA